MIEFGLGVAATLAAEFGLAHLFMWWENRKQTARTATSLASNTAVLAAAQSAPGWIRKEVTTLEGDAKAVLGDVEKFFHIGGNTVPVVTNTAPAPVAQTAPVGTPVPAATLTAPATDGSAQTVKFG